MITAAIRAVIRWRAAVWLLVGAGIVFSLYSLRIASLDAIPDISDPQIVVYVKWARSPQLLETEVTEPLISALVGSADIQSIRSASHMGYSFIYVILANGASRDRVQQLVLDRISVIRPQLPADASVTLGPNASSMGWIYQYALVDPERGHDLRELRLINESQIKPALQTVPGIAEVASVGGLEKQYQLKIFPPLLAKAGISLRQVIDAVQEVFQEAGGRMIEVTNRDYQLRGVVNGDDVDKLQFLVVGRSASGAPVYLKDVGYVQVGYDQRRSTVDLDGEGEVAGGIVIMEQDRNVLAVTRALEQKLEQIRPTLPAGVEIVATYDRSAWIWSTLRQFFETLGIELVVLIVVTLLFLRNLRTAIGPIAILLLSVLFTAIPLVGFRQTINLFSLAGLAIAIGEIADATIVIVENCTAELALRGAGQPGRTAGDSRSLDRVSDQAAALLALDYSRVVSAGVLSGAARSAPLRSAGLQQDLRDGFLDAADDLPPSADRLLDLQAQGDSREQLSGERGGQGVPVCPEEGDPLPLRFYDGRHARADSGRSAARDLPAGLPAGYRRGLHPVHADDPARASQSGGRVDSAADGQEAEGIARSRAGVRQDWTGGHVHRSCAADDD